MFQNDEPPEITYCVVGGEGGLALQAVTPTHPMPPQDELDAKFAELVVSAFFKGYLALSKEDFFFWRFIGI